MGPSLIVGYEATETLLGAFNLILGVLLGVIATHVSRKGITGKEYLPILSFSVWWYSAGASFAIRGIMNLTDVLWRPDLPLHVTSSQVTLLLAALALFSLSHYFAYLFIGPNKLWVPLAVIYGLSAMALLYMINYQQPIGLSVEGGQISVVYGDQLPTFSVARRLAVVMFVPPLLGLLGYLSLYKRVPTTIQRYRVVIISITIFLVFLNIFISQIFDLEGIMMVKVTSRLLGVIAATFLLLTYQTPNLFQGTTERGTA